MSEQNMRKVTVLMRGFHTLPDKKGLAKSIRESLKKKGLKFEGHAWLVWEHAKPAPASSDESWYARTYNCSQPFIREFIIDNETDVAAFSEAIRSIGGRDIFSIDVKERASVGMVDSELRIGPSLFGSGCWRFGCLMLSIGLVHQLSGVGS